MSLEDQLADDDARPTPTLVSLAPQFDPVRHGMYVRVLDRALASKDTTLRNVALTGAYGTGKSSILSAILAGERARVIEVSLSTLGAEPDDVETEDGGNPAATTKTNRIQKEIVKQLLYQQAPKDSRESRFRRITRFPRKRESLTAVISGAVLTIILLITGIADPLLTFAGADPVDAPSWLRYAAAVLLLAATCVGAVYLARLALHHRFAIEKVTAGPATISLPPRSASYFDEYLDEIIYFFEANPKVDVVVFEDLDRFDDPHIFEALRALNNLLNAAKQLGDTRRITFVYALRDSVFEQLGRNPREDVNDELKAEIQRANRTKFFDLVVPVAPFISHRNARDLMAESLRKRGHDISRDLVDLAARHAADMRLIHNIVNEYEVFKDRLYDTDDRVPDLTPDRLFAIVLFKNLHLADFEAIRLGQSTLDNLFRTGRDLVEANVQRLRAEEVSLRRALAKDSDADRDAARLADRLMTVLALVSRSVEAARGTVHGSLQVADTLVDDAELRRGAFWRSLVAEDQTLQFSVTDRSGRTAPMTMTVQEVRDLTGHPVDFSPNRDTGADHDTQRLAKIPGELHDVLHHDWAQLAADDRFSYSADHSPARTFREWTDATLTTPLARELVKRGYLTSYFSLYAASFHGEMMSPAATIYFMRTIDRGEIDTDFVLTADDVDALIRERASFLDEDSMHNVSVLDHVLGQRLDVAHTVLDKLARWGAAEQRFVETYLGAGTATDRLVEYLTPRVAQMFDFLVRATTLVPDTRDRLVDTALHTWESVETYPPSSDVQRFLEDSYSRLPSLTDPSRENHAGQAVEILVHQGAVLPDVAPLSDAALRAIAKTTAYTVNVGNLQILTGGDDLSLDVLRATGGALLRHALDQLPVYLSECSKSPGTQWTTADPELFVDTITAVAHRRVLGLGDLIRRAHRDCRVADLELVSRAAWAPLVEDVRVPATYENVRRYLDSEKSVDAALAVLLAHSRTISETADVDLESRVRLAVTLVNAGDVLPDPGLRVELAASLQPGTIPINQVPAESGELFGRMLEAGLLADDEYTFSGGRLPDWPTTEFAIAHAPTYSEYVGPGVLPGAHFARVFASTVIADDVKRTLLKLIVEFAANSDLALEGRVAAARYAVTHAIPLGAAELDVLLGDVPEDIGVELLAAAIDDLGSDDVRSSLQKIGGEYAKLASVGSGYADIGSTEADAAIIRRMTAEGVVSSVKSRERGSRVWRRQAGPTR